MDTAFASEDLKLRSGLTLTGGDERGTLRHTWLERRLLYELKVDREAWLNAAPGDILPEVLAGIPWQLERLNRMMIRMVDEYSPAQLVDRGPLAGLPEPTKSLLRQSLHDAYLATGIIQACRDDWRCATEHFSLVAASAPEVWRRGGRANKLEFLNSLEAAAKRLCEALALPQGVVLP